MHLECILHCKYLVPNDYRECLCSRVRKFPEVMITGNFRPEISCKIMVMKSVPTSYGNRCVENQHYIRVVEGVASRINLCLSHVCVGFHTYRLMTSLVMNTGDTRNLYM